MQKENNLVRKMYSCETMGGSDIICSDKTGTLTQNKMTVNELWVGGLFYNFEKKNSPRFIKNDFLSLLRESIFLNTTAFIDPKKGQQGSKSEIALLLLMNSLGCSDYLEMRLNAFESFHKFFPFSSKRKKSSVVVTKDNNALRLHIKGAPEVVIKSCSHYLNADGSVVTLENEDTELLNTTINQMTERALRVLALAYKDMTKCNLDLTDENGFPAVESNGLVLIALAGIRDPIREEVPDAVIKCQNAGIRIIMVTGDNKSTAKAIAKECNIITSDSQIVMEGKEFAELTGGTVCETCRTKDCPCPRNKKLAEKEKKQLRKDTIGNFSAFKTFIDKLAVVARSSPDDKYTLVTGLKQMGHVVAVTGDGTNDAPALRKADIGFAMGITGTEMAKKLLESFY